MMHPHGSQDLTKDSSRRPLVRRITREIFKDVHPPKESAFSRAKTLKVHPEDIVAPPLVRKLTRRVGRTQRTWILLKVKESFFIKVLNDILDSAYQGIIIVHIP